MNLVFSWNFLLLICIFFIYTMFYMIRSITLQILSDPENRPRHILDYGTGMWKDCIPCHGLDGECCPCALRRNAPGNRGALVMGGGLPLSSHGRWCDLEAVDCCAARPTICPPNPNINKKYKIIIKIKFSKNSKFSFSEILKLSQRNDKNSRVRRGLAIATSVIRPIFKIQNDRHRHFS